MPLVRAEVARVGEEEVPAAPVERDSATAEAHFETQRKRCRRQSSSMVAPACASCSTAMTCSSVCRCRFMGSDRYAPFGADPQPSSGLNISPNKRNAFVLPEHYTEGVKIFTFTAYRNNHSSKASISIADFWRRNADRVNSALWTD